MVDVPISINQKVELTIRYQIFDAVHGFSVTGSMSSAIVGYLGGGVTAYILEDNLS